MKKIKNIVNNYCHNGDLTTYMGVYEQDDIETLETLMENVIYDSPLNIKETILHHKEGVDLIPSNLELSGMEVTLANAMSRECIMKNVIQDIKQSYDYILIDCMPSLGMLTINALACSDKIIIPVQSQYFAAKGMGHLLKTVSKVRKNINPELQVGGMILTLVDKRTNLAKDIRNELKENYGSIVNIYNTEIPLAIKTAESTSSGKSIFEYDKNSSVAKAYNEFAEEVLKQDVKERKQNALAKGYER